MKNFIKKLTNLVFIYALLIFASTRCLSKFRTTSLIRGVNVSDRHFFVRVIFFSSEHQLSFHCGGAIIHYHWVVTSAQCILDEVENILVEVTDYMVPGATKETTPISKIIKHRNFGLSAKHLNWGMPTHDIALLKTINRFPYFRTISMCEDYSAICSLFGTCNLGFFAPPISTAVSADNVLQEVAMAMRPRMRCPEENFCMEPVIEGELHMSSTDRGSPLYAFYSRSRTPSCLVGVASYSRQFPHTAFYTPFTVDYFVSLIHYSDWIQEQLMVN